MSGVFCRNLLAIDPEATKSEQWRFTAHGGHQGHVSVYEAEIHKSITLRILSTKFKVTNKYVTSAIDRLLKHSRQCVVRDRKRGRVT